MLFSFRDSTCRSALNVMGIREWSALLHNADFFPFIHLQVHRDLLQDADQSSQRLCAMRSRATVEEGEGKWGSIRFNFGGSFFKNGRNRRGNVTVA